MPSPERRKKPLIMTADQERQMVKRSLKWFGIALLVFVALVCALAVVVGPPKTPLQIAIASGDASLVAHACLQASAAEWAEESVGSTCSSAVVGKIERSFNERHFEAVLSLAPLAMEKLKGDSRSGFIHDIENRSFELLVSSKIEHVKEVLESGAGDPEQDVAGVENMLNKRSNRTPAVLQLDSEVKALRVKYSAVFQRLRAQRRAHELSIRADEIVAAAARGENAVPLLEAFARETADAAKEFPRNKEVSEIRAGLPRLRTRVEKAFGDHIRLALFEKHCGRTPPNERLASSVLERIVRRTANDPDSIEAECLEPEPTSDTSVCWVSSCNVRGANAFGAKVLNVVRIGIVPAADGNIVVTIL